jgi:hypothetical protein
MLFEEQGKLHGRSAGKGKVWAGGIVRWGAIR